MENEKEQKAFAANERTRGLAKQIINFVETMVVRLCILFFFPQFIFFLFSEREKRVARAWTDKAQRGLVSFARGTKRMLENKMSRVADE